MDIIQELYEKRDEEGRQQVRRHRPPAKVFRPSEMGDCRRRIWYRLSGYVPAPRSAISDDYGIDGDDHHNSVRNLLQKYVTEVEGIAFYPGRQEELDSKRRMFEAPNGIMVTFSGRLDGRIAIPNISKNALLEIKSLGYWPYHHLNEAFIKGGAKAALERIEEKHPYYLDQVTTCMAMFDLDVAYLVVKSRDSGTIGLYNPDTGERHGGAVVHFDAERWAKLLQRAGAIMKQVQKGEPPIPEYMPGSKQCGFCPFRYLCHDADQRRKQGLTPAIVYPDPLCGLEFEEAE